MIETGTSTGRTEPTAEELAVVLLLAQGLQDLVIARRLGVSAVTVRRRIHRFRNRVGANTRAQAVAIAAAKGWLSLDDVGAEG